MLLHYPPQNFVEYKLSSSYNVTKVCVVPSNTRVNTLRCKASQQTAVVTDTIQKLKQTESGDGRLTTVVPSMEKEQANFTDYREGVLLQAFGWDSCRKGNWYNTLQDKVQDFSDSGITHVWLPPPSQSVSAEGYLPGRLYDLNSKYGNKEELISLNNTLKSAYITPIADIVVNHRCANIQDEQGRWNTYEDTDPYGNKISWDRYAITSNDPVFGGKGNPDTGEDFWGAPDLDHTNENLRKDLIDWMRWLKDGIGFMGWRFDFVKGFAPKYVKEYILESVGADTFNVGENWPTLDYNDFGALTENQDGNRQVLCDWVNEAGDLSCAFDFTLKGILQEAIRNTQYWRLRDSNNKSTGMLGWWGAKAVSFIDNHDTGSSQQHWPFPAENIETGYAYILTHPGMPCIFWEHLYDWSSDMQSKIKELMALRKSCGLRADSYMNVLVAEDDLYVANIADKVIVKLGPRFDMGQYLPSEKDGWKLASSGKDFAIWAKN